MLYKWLLLQLILLKGGDTQTEAEDSGSDGESEGGPD